MSGIFKGAQPIYAEHGIATFPVGSDKKPAITNYQRVGLRGSSQLVARHGHAPMLGYVTGARHKVTCGDVDSTDERIFADALNKHGDTPVKIRTSTGKYHALYKYNGEKRIIRAFGKGPDNSPIDILGSGGYVVTPPSTITGKGSYEIIEGSLDDLDRLPVMQNLPAHCYDDGALLAPFIPDGDELRIIPSGSRNRPLYQFCLHTAQRVSSLDALVAEARNFYATNCEAPMDATEIVKVSNWAWNKTLKDENWFGTGQRIVMAFDEFDTLGDRATLLLLKLRRHHWGEQFQMTKMLASALGWRVQNFKAARDELIRAQIIECIHPGGRHPNDPPLYRFLKRSRTTRREQ